MKKTLWALLFALLFPLEAYAARGLFISSSATCADVKNPEADFTYCLPSTGANKNQLLVYNGSAFVAAISGTGSAVATVQDEGSALTQRSTINFTGAGITCTDNSGSSRTDCDVPGGGGSGTVDGSGSTGHIAAWSDSDTLQDGPAYDSGTTTITATLSGNASTATALAANGSNCSSGSAPLGVDASGAAEGCFDVATQTELDAHTTSTSVHSATSANTASRIVLRDASGNFSAGTITAALTGNASTSTALAANGANCSSGNAPLGVDASGAVEGCFDVATQTELDAHINDTSAAHAASAISNTAAGNISSTDVQAAINELDTEKQGVLTNSAGLRAALSDETGTGAAVFADTPTLVTPNIGAATGTSLAVSTDVTVGGQSVCLEDGTNCPANSGTDDQTAAEVPFTPAGNIAATDVQAAIEELDTEKQPLDSDLTALAGNSSNGLWAHTGAGTGAARTITGTSNQISVANGDGASGNPTISVPSSAQLSVAKLTNLTSNGFVKTGSGDGTLSVDTTVYCQQSGTNCPSAGSETDPVVGAVNGIVKADGAGNISAASAGTDYENPLTFNSPLSRSTNTISCATCLTSVTVDSPLSGSGTSGSHLVIANAAADGSTKGAASFNANDFNASSGNISIDYTNGQAASGSTKGFLTSSDWTTFNSKVGTSRAVNTTSPITGGGDLSADRTIACATCVTSAASLTNNLPVFGAGSQAAAVGTRSGNTTKVVTMDASTPATNDCAKWDASGNLTTAGAACGSGGGGTPAGSDTQVQFNDAGSFGGDAGFTYDKTNDRLIITGSGYNEITKDALTILNTNYSASPDDGFHLGQYDDGGVFFSSGNYATYFLLNAAGANFLQGALQIDANENKNFGLQVTDTISSFSGLDADYKLAYIQPEITATDGVDGQQISGLTVRSLVGPAAEAYVGNVNNVVSTVVISGSGDADNEYSNHLTILDARIGTGYTQSAGPVGRLWGSDLNVLGPIGVQPDLLNGITQLMLNPYNGSPADSPSGGLWLVTRPGTGGGIDATKGAATSYPLDVAIGCVGYSGASTTTSPSANGWNTCIQIGGHGSGWMPNTENSRIGTGIDISQYVTRGIYLNGATGTPTAGIELDSSAGGIIEGSLTASRCVKTDGSKKLTSASADCQPLDATLTALAAYNTNGILTQTAADTFTGRTITGTSNRISMTNGDGVSGNPTITVPDSAQLNVAKLVNLTSNGFVKTGSSDGTLSVDTTTYITSSAPGTLTNLTLDAEGTGNAITIPFTLWLPMAGCAGTTAGSIWDLPSSSPMVATCTVGTNTVQGYGAFADGSNLSAQYTWRLPSDWSGNIDATFKWFTSATSGSVVWQMATTCVADAETNDPSFNTASTVTDAAKGTTLQTNDASISSVTVTGCAAGELMHIKIFRDSAHASDNLAATANLIGVEIKYRRAM